MKNKYLIIGAGPCGLSAVHSFKNKGIAFDCVEAHYDFGGQWAIENPYSSMYQSAHLISSTKVMEYDDFPFTKDFGDYPSHEVVKEYFNQYVEKNNLRSLIEFNTKVKQLDRLGEGNWKVIIDKEGVIEERFYSGVILANGIFSHPNRPKLKGEEKFQGQVIHSSEYKEASLFDGKKVLIVGAGNSGCDIAVDAVHRAKKVHMSVRRGYYFVPKYLFGKPADQIREGLKLPRFIDLKIKEKILKTFTGDPVKYGFPKPDYKLFESHPVVNSLIVHHLGHGDIDIMNDIQEIKEKSVLFQGGEDEEYDLILLATGFNLNYPFIDKKLLNWKGHSPKLHLNIFHPDFDDLFVLGMVEATGIGFQGRYDQANLVANFIKYKNSESIKMKKFKAEKKENKTDLRNKRNYLKLKRMDFYVDKQTYLKKLRSDINKLEALN